MGFSCHYAIVSAGELNILDEIENTSNSIVTL